MYGGVVISRLLIPLPLFVWTAEIPIASFLSVPSGKPYKPFAVLPSGVVCLTIPGAHRLVVVHQGGHRCGVTFDPVGDTEQHSLVHATMYKPTLLTQVLLTRLSYIAVREARTVNVEGGLFVT